MSMPPEMATATTAEEKPKPLTDKAMHRLVGIGVSNGLKASDFMLLWSEEDVYTLRGLVILSPLFEQDQQHQVGSAVPKECEMVASLPQMRELVENRKAEFYKNQASWLPDAKAELKTMPGEGWGLDNAKITLPKEEKTYAATTTCPDCRGARTMACLACQATGFTMCRQCYGRGREDCYLCSGTGRDAHDQTKLCYECQGTLLAACRACAKLGYMNGHVPCPSCQGKGGVACQSCGGQGCFTEIVRITAGAQTTFRLQTGGLPSGLNRALDRLGLDNLGKGHAKIETFTPDKDDPEYEGLSETERQSILNYRALLPFADILLSIKGQKMKCSVFGQKASILGMPPFLDEVLREVRDALSKSSRSKSWLQLIKKYHATNLVMSLILQGRASAREVRRHYPIGLSPKVIDELLYNGRHAIRDLTKTTRLIVGAGTFGISAALFVFTFLSEYGHDLFVDMPLWQGWLIKASLVPLISLIAIFDMKMGAAITLRRYFPKQKSIRNAELGKIGWGLVASISLLWGLCAGIAHFQVIL